jgi:hypothetical protein
MFNFMAIGPEHRCHEFGYIHEARMRQCSGMSPEEADSKGRLRMWKGPDRAQLADQPTEERPCLPVAKAMQSGDEPGASLFPTEPDVVAEIHPCVSGAATEPSAGGGSQIALVAAESRGPSGVRKCRLAADCVPEI